MQQQEAITFHSAGKLPNPKPLIYLFWFLGA
jgi:hypothetical protein